ncbi:hypothetical protein H5U35_02785 [Candidatus Aerophobetes bacterium]|nr:hypothetical protein [Candidatus Aerophobetes bacterium]
MTMGEGVCLAVDQRGREEMLCLESWIPAFAGMTWGKEIPACAGKKDSRLHRNN